MNVGKIIKQGRGEEKGTACPKDIKEHDASKELVAVQGLLGDAKKLRLQPLKDSVQYLKANTVRISFSLSLF